MEDLGFTFSTLAVTTIFSLQHLYGSHESYHVGFGFCRGSDGNLSLSPGRGLAKAPSKRVWGQGPPCRAVESLQLIATSYRVLRARGEM